MILRHIAENLRNENWTALVIELIVVVLGIFIGFQVDRWYEDQRELKAEAIYLERMHFDIQAMLDDAEVAGQFGQDRLDSMIHVYRSLQGSEIIDGDAEQFEYGLGAVAFLPSLSKVDTTYLEMLQNGSFARLGNVELKRTIVELYQSYEMMSQQLPYYRGFASSFEALLTKMADYRFAPFDTGKLPENFSDHPISVQFDFAELAANREVRNGFYMMVDTHNDWVEMHKRIVKQLEKADRLLSAQ